MREVDFSNIGFGMESSPSFTKQIQDGLIDRFAALLQALTNGSNAIVKVYGCVMTVIGNQYNQTSGVVFYQGNLYSVDAFSGTHATQIPVYVFDNLFTRQAWYGDSVKRDTFFTRKMKLQFGASGSGLGNFNQTVLLQDQISDFINLPGKLLPYAPLNSPSLTGTPTAPTAAPGTATQQIATTQFVMQVRDALINGAPGVLDTLMEISNALGGDANLAATLNNAIAIANNNANGRVLKAGDVMSGNLSIPPGTLAAHAVRKDQLDAVQNAADNANNNADGRVSKSGDTMSGPLTMNGGYRTRSAGNYRDFFELEIGAWDMNSLSAKDVAHGISNIALIRRVSVMIFDDSVTGGYGISDINTSGAVWGSYIVNGINIQLQRTSGGMFATHPSFSGGGNRGYITIELAV